MNRKEFLKNCACAVCSCAAFETATPAHAAETKPPAEDWRLGFMRSRYSKLTGILAAQMSEAEFNATFRKLGYQCASGYWLVRDHKGDIDGFIREFKQRHNEDITYDREKKVVTVIGPERTECFCPLIDGKTAPKTLCNCSLGWQQCTYETILGRKVKVEITDSVLRGGKRCCFRIQILEEKA